LATATLDFACISTGQQRRMVNSVPHNFSYLASSIDGANARRIAPLGT
jgi:hypothetical protein